MIIANLIGGLGNQMFQYACGRALALDLGQVLACSVDQFEGYTLHQGLQLDRVFRLDLAQADARQLRRLLGRWRTRAPVRRVLARLASPWLSGRRFVGEPLGGFAPDLRARCADGAYLHGYWQSELYFESQVAAIRADFAGREPLTGRNASLAQAIETAPCTVSVHVRRGDYVSKAKNTAIYAALSPAYYLAALDRLSALAPAAGLQVFAFSDDPPWVAELLAPHCPNLTLVDHNRGADSHLDMRLMALCRHHVIANSSFSWWGAWLDARPDKRVIAPLHWYADGRDTSSLVPAHWDRL